MHKQQKAISLMMRAANSRAMVVMPRATFHSSKPANVEVSVFS